MSSDRVETLGYPICSTETGWRKAIEEISKRLIGDVAKVHEESSQPGMPEYVVRVPTDMGLTDDETQKLRQLCRLRSRQMRDELGEREIQNHSNHEAQLEESCPKDIPSPSAAFPRNKPDALRIRSIPICLQEAEVLVEICKNFDSLPTIHSLVPSSAEFQHATATFPNKDNDFPIGKLAEIKESRGSGISSKYTFDYDTDFLSFTALYDAGDNAVVDIFAVPGLGTHAYGTFRSPAPNSTEIWLRDFLHIHIPEIRVVLYGYPSKVDNAKSIEKIEDIASKMLDKLVHFRQDTSTQTRPIIFLGQSLGGLIVQETLLLAEHSNKMEEVELFQAWYGLVGFGIPTIGLNNPSLLAAVKGQPNQALMKQLCLDDKGTPSPYLQKLKLRFEDCLRQRIKSSTAAEIIYFWETHKSVPRLRPNVKNDPILMVAKDEADQAVLGVRWLSLNSDHAGMVKYTSKVDELYEDVRNNIKGMVKNVKESVGSQELVGKTTPIQG